MKKKSLKLALSICMTLASKAASEEVSFSDFSKMKDSATRIGTYLAALEACNTNSKLRENFQSSIMKDVLEDIWDPSTTLTSAEVKDIVLQEMERSGLDFEKLSALDDIIRERENEIYPKINAQFNNSFEATVGVCIDVMPSSVSFKKIENLPDDPVQRIISLGNISPLNQ